MAYITRQELTAEIPSDDLKDCLDDDRDGTPDDVLDTIIAVVSREIDGFIGRRYPLPLATVPAIVATAAFYLCVERLYKRRKQTQGDRNPGTKDAAYWREQLQKIASGEMPLDATTAAATTIGGGPSFTDRTLTFTRDDQDGA